MVRFLGNLIIYQKLEKEEIIRVSFSEVWCITMPGTYMNIFKIPNNLHQQFMILNVNRKYHTLMKQLEIYTQNLPEGF